MSGWDGHDLLTGVTIPVAIGRDPNEANDFNCEEEMLLGAMDRLTPETAVKREAADKAPGQYALLVCGESKGGHRRAQCVLCLQQF